MQELCAESAIYPFAPKQRHRREAYSSTAWTASMSSTSVAQMFLKPSQCDFEGCQQRQLLVRRSSRQPVRIETRCWREMASELNV